MSDFEKTGRYVVLLMIKHPTERPEKISAELGLQPDRGWAAGQERTTPAGTRLSGVYQETAWTCTKRAEGQRFFFQTAVEFLDTLEAAAEFIRGLLSSGGRAELVVHLPGKTNIGDVLTPDNLLRLGRLGIGLGVEVFPELA